MNILVTGAFGQDGQILIRSLKEQTGKIKLFLVARNFKNKGTKNGEVYLFLDLNTVEKLCSFLIANQITSIYHFAGNSHNSMINSQFQYVFTNKLNSFDRILMKSVKLVYLKTQIKIKVLLCGSSEIFLGNNQNVITENSIPHPLDNYSRLKANSFKVAKVLREEENLDISTVHLFSHDSIFRKSNFFVPSLIQSVVEIFYKEKNFIDLWDINECKDRSSAWDIVDGIQKLMESKFSTDLVFGSGKLISVEEMVIILFDYLNIDNWSKYIRIVPRNRKAKIYTKHQIADYSLARDILNWKPKIDFKNELITMLDFKLKSFKIK